MSLLSELQQKKAKLKSTDSIVTRQDGQKFVENKFEVKKLNEVTHGFVVDTQPDDVPAKIIEHLYLGAQDCCELDVLSKYDIKFVLSLGIEVAIKSPTVTYKFINILDLDRTDLYKYLPDCISFIDNCLNCKENVLVHCNAGVSRSASIVISYLIVQNKLTFESAYETVKKVRPCIRPNDGFMVQLRKLKQNNFL